MSKDTMSKDTPEVAALREQLASKEAALAEAGGRGVELAEEVDRLRVDIGRRTGEGASLGWGRGGAGFPTPGIFIHTTILEMEDGMATETDNVAMIYLFAVEDECAHVSMAQDRFACGGDYANQPGAPSLILAWMEDELTIQREQHDAHPDEHRNGYIAILERDCAILDLIGVTANPEFAFETLSEEVST